MIDEPEENSSAGRQKPNSLVDQSTISAPIRERWVAQIGRRAEVVEGEIAVGDGVDRVLDDRLEPELGGDRGRSMSQLRPARAPEPSGITAAARSAAAKRSASRRSIQNQARRWWPSETGWARCMWV